MFHLTSQSTTGISFYSSFCEWKSFLIELVEVNIVDPLLYICFKDGVLPKKEEEIKKILVWVYELFTLVPSEATDEKKYGEVGIGEGGKRLVLGESLNVF